MPCPCNSLTNTRTLAGCDQADKFQVADCFPYGAPADRKHFRKLALWRKSIASTFFGSGCGIGGLIEQTPHVTVPFGERWL
jgi:hypothetical protein